MQKLITSTFIHLEFQIKCRLLAQYNFNILHLECDIAQPYSVKVRLVRRNGNWGSNKAK
jgi:hypothetical protein